MRDALAEGALVGRTQFNAEVGVAVAEGAGRATGSGHAEVVVWVAEQLRGAARHAAFGDWVTKEQCRRRGALTHALRRCIVSEVVGVALGYAGAQG